MTLFAVRIFGFHFAAMDVRQDSSIHGQTVEEVVQCLITGSPIFWKKQYLELTETEKLDTLKKMMERNKH